ncbi:hypothetical protein X474_14225 [Dethiosulfatarculus sandiegensis]|uniref:Uncharacterized protein n=1 Tax=Dethiosulfatarculus sandiegensis TaxID=1429043 RepID=A0A0D2JCD1_9BACT|nr:hypothetical protein X474_14225 [Dethiosulfatarculus sandiegensis]
MFDYLIGRGDFDFRVFLKNKELKARTKTGARIPEWNLGGFLKKSFNYPGAQEYLKKLKPGGRSKKDYTGA